MAERQRTEREYDSDTDSEPRSEFQRDRDRIFYSRGFRRLSGITQVAAAGEVPLLHTRLTHSLKVGQVGRRLTERLIKVQPELAAAAELDPDVVETACLAHDLGHPPFGHVAEQELDRLLNERNCGGFEGNAQTFRYLTKLASRRVHGGERIGAGALDLTRASLNATLKYPQRRDENPPNHHWHDRRFGTKWGTYTTEGQSFAFAREGCAEFVRSSEAIIMDWADDISYAVHDIEDYVRVGLIPMHRLKDDEEAILATAWKRLAKKPGFDKERFHTAFLNMLQLAPDQHYQGGRQDEHWLGKWVSGRITDFESAVELGDEPGFVFIPEDHQYEVEALKNLTWHYVINSPRFAAVQEGQRRLTIEIFDRLEDWADKRGDTLPLALWEKIDEVSIDPEAASLKDASPIYTRSRAIVDWLCTLTEPQVVALNDRLSGTSPAAFLGSWVS